MTTYHSGENEHVCHECGLVLGSAKTLAAHMDLHKKKRKKKKLSKKLKRMYMMKKVEEEIQGDKQSEKLEARLKEMDELQAEDLQDDDDDTEGEQSN